MRGMTDFHHHRHNAFRRSNLRPGFCGAERELDETVPEAKESCRAGLRDGDDTHRDVSANHFRIRSSVHVNPASHRAASDRPPSPAEPEDGFPEPRGRRQRDATCGQQAAGPASLLPAAGVRDRHLPRPVHPARGPHCGRLGSVAASANRQDQCPKPAGRGDRHGARGPVRRAAKPVRDLGTAPPRGKHRAGPQGRGRNDRGAPDC